MTKLIFASVAAASLAAPRAVACLPRADRDRTSLMVSSGALADHAARTPRALTRDQVRANQADPATVINEMSATVKSFIERNDKRVGDLEAHFDKHLKSEAALRLGGGSSAMPEDPEYSRTFASFIRNGQEEEALKRLNAEGYRSQIKAAMSVNTPGDGGYLAPVEWDRMVRKAQQDVSPMRRLAMVVTTGVGGYSTVWSDNAWGSGWVGETAARPETTTPGLDTLVFASGEIYANAAITQRLLDDSALDIESWLSSEIADEFGRQEGVAFLSGDGVNKPQGLLTYVPGGTGANAHPGGTLAIVNSGSASDITSDGLVDFAYSLPAPYRQGASWLMNSTTAAVIAKLKDGDGNYLWRESYRQGEPSTLLGYPVAIDEGMPAIAADATPIAFGNFSRGYVINDRLGIRTLRDPYTNKPFVNFYTTKRVGAGVLDPNAIRLLKISA